MNFSEGDASINKQQLYYGDNLDVLCKIPSETVDLCYIDPPFNSKRNYNQIYNNIGKEDTAQSMAFVDTWEWNLRAEKEYDEICRNQNGVFTPQTSDLIRGLYNILGKGSLLSYLISMTQRINEIYRVLKPTGSFYLHCDPTASHYLKLVLDAVFCGQGGEFKNEIVWKRTFSHNDAKGYGRIKDSIFFYVKSGKFTWNKTYQKYDDKYIRQFYNNQDARGVYQAITLTGPGINPQDPQYKDYHPNEAGRSWSIPRETIFQLAGEKAKELSTLEKLELLEKHDYIIWSKNGTPRFKRYLDETKGVPLQDIWTDLPPISSQAKERLGYPTQKPEALLERIIKASSNEGDVVLDAFCGCGTTVAVAQRLNRKWIGIDITYNSISLILKRLTEAYGSDVIENEVEVSGIPMDIESAKALALKKDDRLRKEFEKWAILTYSDNRAMINDKKGKDYGIDGRMPIPEGRGQYRDVLFSVKSGNVNSGMVRDFRGTIERENAAAGIFITLKEPTKDMIKEAIAAGFYSSDYLGDIEKIKIVTIEQILKKPIGERLDKRLSSLAADVLKKAEQATAGDNQITLL